MGTIPTVAVMPTHSGLNCFCHSHLGHTNTRVGGWGSCKWSYGWERHGNQLSELDGWTAPALAPPTLTTTCIPMSPLTRTRSEEPIDAVGRHHAHGSQADGSRERIAVLVHVVGTEVFCPGHWRLHIDGGQGWDSNELSHQQQFWFTQRLRGSATPLCFTGHVPFSPQGEAGFACFGLRFCHTFT